MSAVHLKDADNASFRPHTFPRDESGQTVLAQAVVLVDPATGQPNAATEATLSALKAAALAIQAAAASINGKTVAVDTGDVSISNFPAMQAITGTVGVVGAVEITNDAGNPIQVATGLQQGLTDTQLRAAAVPVSLAAQPLPAGAATETTLAAIGAKLPALAAGRIPVELPAGASGLTDVELRATALAVTGAFIKAEDSPSADGDIGIVFLAQRRDSDTAATSNDGDYATLKMDEVGRLKVATQPGSIAATVANITANAQSIAVNVERASNITISMVATSLVGHNISFEYSNNSTNGTDGNWYGVQVVRSNANTVETTSGVLTATPVYGWEASVNAYKWFRVRATAHTSGTAAYTLLPGSYATEPIPAVQVTAAQPVSGTVSLGAGVTRAGFVAGAGIWYDDSAVVLAAAATFTGTSRDLTVTATATAFANAATYTKEIRVSAESDQSGTLWLEVSRDNTNWRRVKSVATAAVAGGGQYAEIIHSPSWRYVRVGFTNGATLQTRFSIGSMLLAL